MGTADYACPHCGRPVLQWMRLTGLTLLAIAVALSVWRFIRYRA
jgi:hypothetical protein